TVDWMYADPAALKLYGEYSGLPAAVVQQVREFIPKDTMAPERVVGLDQIVADAVKLKFIADPLTPVQLKDFVQIPTPQWARVASGCALPGRSGRRWPAMTRIALKRDPGTLRPPAGGRAIAASFGRGWPCTSSI